MEDLKQIAKQAGLNGGHRMDYRERQPSQYADRQFEYFANTTHLFREQYLEYASDFFEAEIQNWDNNGEWETVYIRMADVVRPSAAIQRHFDQYKMVIPRDPSINYLQPGTKIRAMGSYWLVVNPMNISGGEGSAIVQRCNAVWNYLDWYGNVVSEPIIVENARANASAPDAQTDQRIATGYYNVTCQYNDFTRQINDNTRLILGSKAYQVTGYGDFDTEFTGDYSSVRLLSFSIRVLTQNDATDDMENHVAGGKAFSFEGVAEGPACLNIGQYEDYSVVTYRNGENVDPLGPQPFNWIWTSNTPLTATITANGTAHGIKSGLAIFQAVLAQNPNIFVIKRVTVVAGSQGVRFVSGQKYSLEPYTFCNLEAFYYDSNGQRTADPVTFSFSGADAGSYSTATDNNMATIHCFGYSGSPLVITAECNGETATAIVELNGF